MEPNLFFSLLAAGISLGGVLIGFGVIKGKVAQNAEANKTQSEQIENCASRIELTAAIKRSDEMLAIITKRAEEDRALGEGRYKEYYALLTGHAERIKVLETTQQALTKSLDDIKVDLKVGFKELQNELKELRKQGTNGIN
jgi:hypothetical protein